MDPRRQEPLKAGPPGHLANGLWIGYLQRSSIHGSLPIRVGNGQAWIRVDYLPEMRCMSPY